jgi:SAM-dependent methyltransferase
MQDPATSPIPLPPNDLMDAVAGQHVTNAIHVDIGYALFQTIVKHCAVLPSDCILDIGSGCGRVATPFASYLTSGTYDGVDIVLPMVQWCSENISSRVANFRFHHADLSNTLYSNSGGDASQYRFPFLDDYFDVIFATSVFTHLVPTSAQQYAREIARMLKKDGGRALLTFYLLNDSFRRRRADGVKDMADFPHQMDGYSVMNRDNPEAVLAFEESGAARLLTQAGLYIHDLSLGTWSGHVGWTYQDVFLVSKAV